MIPYGRQNISDEDIDAVVDVLKSDFLTQGPAVALFEDAIAKYCGSKRVVAFNSATSALHLACLSLGVGEGDFVWTSAITFVASANCARYCGANVDFVDIDPLTYNMSLASLTNKLERAERDGCLPKVVIPVHLAGLSCDMQGIHRLSQKYGFKVIEDASHAIGSSYQGHPVGSCHYSDITIFSFHPVKIITTGEGGVAVINNEEIANQMVRLRSHGITRDPAEMTSTADGPWYYQQLELGYNYRLNDMEAGLGISQLQRLDSFIETRNSIAARYHEILDGLPVTFQKIPTERYSSYHLYIIRVDSDKLVHREVFERFRVNGIGVNLHYIPVYHHPYYQQFGYKVEDFPEAEAYYREAISLPIYPDLSQEQQDQVVRWLKEPIGHQTLF
jgi:UDP-4-amino-4,6-dideoxy-N-acetyl-beta-L-altrosamine transaminase